MFWLNSLVFMTMTRRAVKQCTRQRHSDWFCNLVRAAVDLQGQLKPILSHGLPWWVMASVMSSGPVWDPWFDGNTRVWVRRNWYLYIVCFLLSNYLDIFCIEPLSVPITQYPKIILTASLTWLHPLSNARNDCFCALQAVGLSHSISS